jgi:hypothetical protein
MMNFFSTVGVAGGASSLPASKPGMQITVINQTGTSMNVFPQVGESVNGVANAAQAVTNAGFVIFACGIAGSWFTK